MSEDLTLAQFGTAGAMTMFKDMIDPEDIEDEFADVPIGDLIPTVKMSKESGTFIVKMKDNVLEGQGGKRMSFAIIMVMGRRALWAPDVDEYEEYKRPVCSSGWQRPSDFRKNNVQGNWQVNPDFQPPYKDESYDEAEDGDRVPYNCANCRWNQYQTAATWSNGASTSKGKACGESRTYFIVPVKRTASLVDAIRQANPDAVVDAIDPSMGVYEFDSSWAGAGNPGIALLDLTMGSNAKAIKDIPTMRRAATQGQPMPLFATVFEAEVDVDKISSSIKLTRFKPQIVGMVYPSHVKWLHEEVVPFVRGFAMENAHKADDVDDAF